MIGGIGVDILSDARLSSLRGKYDDPFFRKAYTEKEYDEGMRRADPITYFTERFAAKEAVFKALNISSAEFRFDDIETLNNDSGKPYVVLYGHTKKRFDELGIKNLHISLSSDGGYVAAFAVSEI